VATPAPPALELRGIVKSFGPVRANDGVDLSVNWGEVHALLGENGAGKSTLMNVVYGLIRQDEGEILFEGRPVEIHGPQDAIRLGIGMVHQHFMLVPPLTVAENVILGRETAGRGGWVDVDAARTAVTELSRRYGLEIDPMARIEDLPVGLQQRVEILKTLYRGARLLILDEPTAVLTPQEVERLFEIVRGLTAEGKGVIFITHKLGEVMEIADRITVMRRGRVVAATTPAASSAADLARLMVGRPVLLQVEKTPARPGAPLLGVADLVVQDDRGHVMVDGVSMEVRAGEIVGLAGVEGNGQMELVEAIVGLRAARSGRILLGDRDMTRAGTKRRLSSGLGHIPADRHRMGIVLELPIADNLVLTRYDREPFARGLVRSLTAVFDYARSLIARFDIRARGPEQPAGDLSGGNQQKVVVARELGSTPKVLLAAQPTRGVDVGSIEFIHRQLVEYRDAGNAVLLVSSELDEVLSLSDRVAVIYRGRLVAVLEGGEIERERIGLLMAGAA
jgi:general nucleoside transport system ATP-binding protein